MPVPRSTRPFARVLLVAVAGIAVLSPVASHAALAMGQGYGVALGIAAVQAVAAGWALRGALARRRLRWLGPMLSIVLLGALAAGGWRSAATGLLAGAGVAHGLLYAGLLALFAATLRPGRDSLVTGLARRLNPAFHAGMVPYTRGVTWAWCGFFAAQLLASAFLLAVSPAAWRVLVTTLHAPLVLAMTVAEFLVRRWRWRHEHYTGLADTIRGMRRISRAGVPGGDGGTAAARTSRPA